MDQLDDDIDFDFFEDEPATTENQPPPPRVRLPGRGGGPRPPRRSLGPPRGATPLLRLLALVAFAVVVLLAFGLLIHSCASSSRHDAYASYMTAVTKISQQSTQNGKALATDLSTTGLTVAQLESKLRSLADQEQQNVNAASSLDPPGRLRPENLYLVQALQLRVNGLANLAEVFQKTASSKDTAKDAASLASQAQRLTASDVVWHDFFYLPALQQLQHDGVSGVQVPLSQYSQPSNPDLLDLKGMSLVLQRLRGASTGGTSTGGLHGSALLSVTAQPKGQKLVTGQLNTVTTGTDLALDVAVQDSGNFQEGQIPVTLTIEQPQGQGSPITQTKTIQVIDPGQTVVLTFKLGSADIPFSSTTTVAVDVAAVPGETNKTNNSAQYQVQFVLP
jgi:hypothetical protein